MEQPTSYKNYPAWIVIISNLFSLGIYGLGFLITYMLGPVFAILYLVYILLFELRLIGSHCTNCFYRGKVCGFGKGKISSWFFKKGDISKFCENEFTFKDMIPDMLITLIPLIIAIILLIIEFNLLLLLAILLLILLTTIGNAYVRGSLTCKYCKQKELGCPADSLFTKKK